MTLAEITYRGRQEASKWIDRMKPARRTPRSMGPLLRHQEPALADTLATLARFQQTAADRFFPGATADVTALFGENLPQVREPAIAIADGICDRSFDVLGYRAVRFGDPIDWHLDPVARRRAPVVHWSAIDPLDPEQVGDSKVIWELSRHQWLVTLAQAHRLSGQERYARTAADLLDSWLDANPRGVGINWTSSLEVSFRLIAFCWAAVLLVRSGWLSARRFERLLRSIWDHARHIERYLSYYFSPNTHLTGEALGLFYAGVLFPEFRAADRWRTLGSQILCAEADRQILDDGGYVEQATCYHCYTIEIYLHFLILAARHHLPVLPEVARRVERMFDFLLAIGRPEGTLPAIGDGDSGQLMPLTRRQPGDCRGLMALGAAHFGRSDLAWMAGECAPDVGWLLGVDGVRRFAELKPRRPGAAASRLFASSGYAVMRNGWEPDGLRMIVDVGPLGCEVSGAHGHADLLSIQCSAFGHDFLIDAGTYCYTPEPSWRSFFRSSTAHSTVVIDGVSQAEPSGPFSWHSRPRARLRTWASNDVIDFVDAAHDAYARLADPVTHRRRVLFLKPRYWLIVDDLAGRAEHHVDVLFQVGTGAVTAGIEPWAWLTGPNNAGLWLCSFSTAPLERVIHNGEVDPIKGWRSSAYGERRPMPVLSCSVLAVLPLRIATVVIPGTSGPSRPPRVELVHGDRQLTGLVLLDTSEVIRIDDEFVSVETSSCAAS